jgi:hypothetical protein
MTETKNWLKVTLDDVDYMYRQMKLMRTTLNMWKEEVSLGERRILPVCNVCMKEFNELDDIVLIINNFKTFPNVFVHKECFEESAPEHIMSFLKKNYEEAKKYEHWF